MPGRQDPIGTDLAQRNQETMSSKAERSRWLVAGRATYFLLAALTLVLYALGTPAYYASFAILHANCLAECLTPAKVQALQKLGISTTLYAIYWVTVNLVFLLVCSAVATLIFWRRSHDGMALCTAVALLALGASFPDIPNALSAAQPAWRLPVTFVDTLGLPSLAFWFFLFPSGRFVPSWTRWIALGFAASYGVSAFLPTTPFNFANWPYLLTILVPLMLVAALVFAQIYRYRWVSTLDERQRTKWVVYGVSVALLGLLLVGFLPPRFLHGRQLDALLSMILITSVYLFLLLIPLTLTIAILRYQLWDVDRVISRTLVYGGLTVGVISFYTLVVEAIGSVFQAQGNVLLSLLATGLIAVLFSPMRDRLQRVVNHLLYGERDEPYRVIVRLGQRLEATLAPGEVLPTIVETVAQALKLPYVAITLSQEGVSSLAASYGAPARAAVRFPLVAHNEQLGELLLAARGQEEPFSSADRALLQELARQAAVALHTVRLMADLQRLTGDLQSSRERLVTTREEERRRLRRDLHDGLGPTLATITLNAEAARDAIPVDAALARDMLEALIEQAQTAISEIRRLVYDLRPPALDDLGLVGAVRASLTQYQHAGLQITLEAPERLPPIPAAVEVAAYRIIQEALTNVVRHAGAQLCSVRLTPGAALRIEISDNGHGLAAEYHPGVGLRSMQERTAELGGSCQVATLPDGGVRISAELPCSLPMPDMAPWERHAAAEQSTER